MTFEFNEKDEKILAAHINTCEKTLFELIEQRDKLLEYQIEEKDTLDKQIKLLQGSLRTEKAFGRHIKWLIPMDSETGNIDIPNLTNEQKEKLGI